MMENAMPMTKQNPSSLDDADPAKGGIEPARDKPHPSGDSPKPHGDPFKDELAPEKTKDRS
jgi:hypothetical protein